MVKSNTGFWRSFTRKQFILISFTWFITTLTVAILFDYFDPAATMAHNLVLWSLIKRLAGSLVIGFFSTIWLEKK